MIKQEIVEHVYVDKDDPKMGYVCFSGINAKNCKKKFKTISLIDGKRKMSDTMIEHNCKKLLNKNATYALFTAYYDETSDVGSREYNGGDIVLGYQGWGTRDSGTVHWDTPGSGAPMKVKIKNLCDRAGNCIYKKATEIKCD